MEIKEETTLAEILENPELEKVLEKYNLPCLGCPMASLELKTLTISKICRIFKLDLKKVLEELNKALGA